MDSTYEDIIETFLLEIYRVYKASHLYPPNHPTLLNMFVKPFKQILPLLDEIEKVVINYKRGEGFFWEDAGIAGRYPVLKELGEEIFKRRIQTVFFLKGLKVTELQSLIDVITTDIKKVQDSGGCEMLLQGKGVRHIWFNEIDYKKILEGQEKEKEKAQEIGITAEKETEHGEGIYDFMEAEGATPEATAPPSPQIPGAEGTGKQEQAVPVKEEEKLPEDLDELIRLWNEAKSLSDFERIGNALIRRASLAATGRDFAAALRVIASFLDTAESAREEKYREFSSRGLDEMTETAGLLDLFFEKACSMDRNAEEILVRLGSRVAGRAADRLAFEEDPHARHVLNDILVRMGKDIIPELLERLHDGRWYMVRNTVRILGEIGEDGTVEDALKPTLTHTDPRVRKETVRALSMIRGKEAPVLLRNALSDEDGGVAELAAVSLGLLRDEGALQDLMELVDRNVENSVKKEALKALGRIGSKKAVSFLIKVIERKGWLVGKKDDELKVMCAAALAEIGTPEAIRALEEGLGSSREAVRKACEEGLRRIRHG